MPNVTIARKQFLTNKESAPYGLLPNMLRRIASLGFDGPDANHSEDGDTKSPIPGDVSPAPSAEPKSAGGLASVFKGLTGGSKTSKAPPIPTSSNTPVSAQLSSERVDTVSLAATGAAPHYSEWLDKLRTGSPSEKVAAADSLRLTLADYPLAPIVQVWDAAKELTNVSRPSSVRTAGWELMAECVKNSSATDLERMEYFQTISAPAHQDDFYLQLTALVNLTNHGRNLSGFDYDAVPLLTDWLADAYNAAKDARRIATEKKAHKGKAVASSTNTVSFDKTFSLLFAFIIEVVKFNFRVADDATMGRLIHNLLEICMKTTTEDDLTACIEVVDTIITYSSIPKRSLANCVEVLSSIYYLVENVQKTAWHTLSNLLKSHNGQATVRVLLDLLREPRQKGQPDNETPRSVRGALSVFQKLTWKSADKGYPAVPLALLIEGCKNTLEKASSTRTARTTMQLINTLFDDGEQNLNPILEDEDWTLILEVAEKCAGLLEFSSKLPQSQKRFSKDDLIRGEKILEELIIFLNRLEGLFQARGSQFVQRQECVAFMCRIPHVLPDSTTTLVLDYFKEFRRCYPSDLEWESNLNLVLTHFLLNRSRSTHVRLSALRAVTEVYDMLELVEDELEDDCVANIVKSILSGTAEETDTLVLQETVSFMVSVAIAADFPLFDYIVDTLNGVIASDRLQYTMVPQSEVPVATDQSRGVGSQSPADVVTRGFVQLFMKVMNNDGYKATQTFNLLVSVARNGRSTDARLTALKMLFRLRADWAHRVYLTSFTESQGLAGVLHRTEASLARKVAEDAAAPQRSKSDHAGTSRSSRGVSFTATAQDRLTSSSSVSGARRGPQRYQQLWALPDPGALPETPAIIASPVLFSHLEKEEMSDGKPEREAMPEPSEDRVGEDEDEDKDLSDDTAVDTELTGVLDVTSWLDAVLQILQNLTSGNDWEVYSFCLVHLASQLSNHALFKSAIPKVREARRILCEQSKLNLFPDPPAATGLRRPEVNICIFQTLTTIMSYHQTFQKVDDDDLVRTFMQGIGHSTAKTCIHALTICCHEMPLATTRALVTILQRMSTVITQPYVAVHILEFLAGLSRLPALYSNFIDDEFRIIFGMCFRYLDTVRDKQRHMRNSFPGEAVGATVNTTHEYDMLGQPTISDDLPQYVYALAYHVIVYWFLALRLSDRAKHVGWIAKRLFQGPDGSLASDEQALVTMDLMQRVAFADADESAESPWFTDDKAAEYTERRWIIANSLISIRKSKTTPWAQVTKRQPSGTSYFTIRENFQPPPPHQKGTFGDSRDRGSLTTNSTLPSHLLVHMLSYGPQSFDPALRPIPLPDEDAVTRSVKIFDRISTVDSHKIGVIYMGENQTKEIEILANVSGSADYMEFLNGIGTLTRLKGAEFNSQGLDREYDTDGQYTFCWRDRLTEMVFHVTTQMPTNLEHDSQCIMKKRHIGNDFVNIVFNDSGLPFKFDLFPSAFNYVYIVITPESRASFVATRENAAKAKAERENGAGEGHSRDHAPFFKVQVMSKEGFPEISPCAATKMVDLKALPDFVRLLALNADVFSQVWANRESGEYPSSWRSRLRELNRLRERYAPKSIITGNATAISSSAAGATSPGGGLGPAPLSLSHALAFAQQQTGQQNQTASSGQAAESRPTSGVRDSTMYALSSMRRASVATFLTSTSEQNSQSHRSSVLSTATTDTEVMQASNLDFLVESLDFSKWA